MIPGEGAERSSRPSGPLPVTADVNARLAAIVGSSDDAIIGKTLDGTITDWNRAAELLYGYSAEEIIGRSLTLLMPPGSEQEFEVLLERTRRGESVAHGEAVHQRKDGTRLDLSLSISPIRDAAGLVVGASTIARDASERRRAEAALRASEERYRQLFEGESDAVLLFDNENGRVLEANAAASAMYGYPHDELLTLTDLDLSAEPEETLARTRGAAAREAKAVAIPQRFHRRRNGLEFPVEISGRFFALEGRTVRIAAVRDVSERKRAEDELAQMTRLYATLSQVNQTIVRVKDPEELYPAICDVAVRFGEFDVAWIGLLDEDSGDIRPVAANGLDRAHWPFGVVNIHEGAFKDGMAATAIRCQEVVVSTDVSTDERMREALERTQGWDFHASAAIPFGVRGKTVGTLVLVSRKAGLFDAASEVHLLGEMGLDISFALEAMATEAERARGEEALRESELQYRGLLETSPVPVSLNEVVGDPNGQPCDYRFLYVNPAFERFMGMTAAELVGRTIIEVAPLVNRAMVDRACLVALTGVPDHFEGHSVGLDKDHETTVYSPKRGQFVTFVDDVTKRKRAQEQLEQMNRLYATLSQVNQTIVRIKEPEELYPAICDVAVEFGGFAVAWVGLLDEASGDVRPVAANGFDLAEWPFGVVNLHRGEFTDGPAATAIRTDEVMVSADAQSDERLHGAHGQMRKRDFHASAAIPFRLKGKVVGVLVLVSQEAGSFAAAAEVNLLDEMGLDISFALDTMQAEAERTRTDEALHRSEGQLRTLIDTLPDLVWLKDPQGVYLSCNRRFESFFGATETDIVGKTDYDFMEADLANAFRQHDQAAMAAGGPTANEEEIVFAEDSHREALETVKTPVHASDGRLIGVLGVGRDITERKSAEEELRLHAEQLRRTVEGAVLAMSHMVESRDPYTAGHERRVAELATAIGAEMGMAGEELDALRLAGTIHDIGKIAVPAEILSKPGRLSETEFELIKAHPTTGFEILADIDFGRPVAEMVRQHHERLDGSGYPRGLKDEEILPEARILAVADVVEAMSSHRPYRAALGMEVALAEVREHAGVKYDADVVAICGRLIEEQGFKFTP